MKKFKSLDIHPFQRDTFFSNISKEEILYRSLLKDNKNYSKTFYQVKTCVKGIRRQSYFNDEEELYCKQFLSFHPDLEYLEIPDCDEIYRCSFYGAYKLKKIIIPEKIKIIPAYYFKCCFGLQEVHLMGKIDFIGHCAFYSTPALKKVVFHQNTLDEIKNFGSYPFGRQHLEKKLVFLAEEKC